MGIFQIYLNLYLYDKQQFSKMMRFIFNSWGRASLPRVIEGTGICKLVTRSLVVDGLRVEASPNSRAQRSQCRFRRSTRSPKFGVRCDQILMRACIVRCLDSEFSLWQVFYSTVRGLLKFKTRTGSLSDEYDDHVTWGLD